MKTMLAALLLLGACASATEVATAEHQACLDYGFKDKSNEYAFCRLKFVELREMRRAAAISRPPSHVWVAPAY